MWAFTECYASSELSNLKRLHLSICSISIIEHREPSYHGKSYIIVAVNKNQTPNLNFVYYEINEERSVCTSMHKCMLKTAAYSLKFKSKTKK